MREFLAGKKTYMVVVITILGSLVAYSSGELSLVEVLYAIAGSLGLGGLRDAIK